MMTTPQPTKVGAVLRMRRHASWVANENSGVDNQGVKIWENLLDNAGNQKGIHNGREQK